MMNFDVISPFSQSVLCKS